MRKKGFFLLLHLREMAIGINAVLRSSQSPAVVSFVSAVFLMEIIALNGYFFFSDSTLPAFFFCWGGRLVYFVAQ